MRFLNYTVFAICAVILLSAGLPTASPTTGPTTRSYTYDATGWTIVTPTGPAIYMDPADGHDADIGNPLLPVKTFGAAYKRATPGGAIYILRGSTLVENLPGSITIAGLTIGAYGPTATPRPIWMLDASKPNGVIHLCGVGQSLLDIDFHQVRHAPGDAGFDPTAPCGHGLYVAADNVLVEGCRFRGFFQAINAIGVANPVIRRNCVVDSFVVGSGHSAGLYTDSVSNALVEQNIFAGNGWVGANPSLVPSVYWQFNHSVYLDDDARPFFPVVFRGNVVADSAGCGLQCRPGGSVTGNFFLDNGAAGLDAFVGGTTGTIDGNVVTGAVDAPVRSTTRGEGLGCDALAGFCTNNLLVHSAGPRVAAVRVSAVTSNGLTYGPASSATVANNIIYDWQGIGIKSDVPRQLLTCENNIVQSAAAAVDFVKCPVTWGAARNVYHLTTPVSPYRIAGGDVSAGTWALACGEAAGTTLPGLVDPDRTIERYSKSTGLDGTAATWLRYAIAQRKGYWLPQYQAAGAVAYFKAGFALKNPVAVPAAQVVPFTVKWPLQPAK